LLVVIASCTFNHSPLLSNVRVNPIWTIDTGSLFLLSVTPEAFFATATGLSFFVKDYDVMGKNDVLGRVVVGQEELLDGKGERSVYALQDTAQPNHPVSEM
jgi:hypothetical protein